MVSLSSLPYRIYSNRIVFDFLNEKDHGKKINKMIELLRNFVNKPISPSWLKNKIYNFMSNRKLGYIVFLALKYFYELEKINVSDLDSIIHFYEYIQKHYNGFARISQTSDIYKNFTNRTKISIVNKLIPLIFPYVILLEKQTIQPSKFISVCNFLILDGIISASEKIEITFFSHKHFSQIIKNIVYRAKKSKIFIDLTLKDNELVCSFYNPINYLPKELSAKFSRRYSNILIHALHLYRPWTIRAFIKFYEKTYLFKLNSESPWAPDFEPPSSLEKKHAVRISFDSKVEKTVYDACLRSLTKNNCNVTREEKLIPLEKNRFFIPDLVIRCNKREYFIEIIGFWTENYARKKREKLQMLPDNIKNCLILVIDSKISRYFEDLPFQKIIYKTEKDAYMKISDTLKKLFGIRNASR